MGDGTYSADTYNINTKAAAESGTAFVYHDTVHARPDADWKAAPELAPIQLAGPTSPLAGKNVRESRDNPEHPLSTPIAIFFDQTGSMAEIPAKLLIDLATVYGIVLRKGYADDPQILIGAYGDAANAERVPFQASQFESDNRIDENLKKLFLEARGGSNAGETSTLVPWFLDQCTATDAWDKRQTKGIAFLIGDEAPLPVPRHEMQRLFDVTLQDDLLPETAFKMGQERWDIYFLVVNNGSARFQHSASKYGALLGEDHVIIVQDTDAIAQTIAGVIGLVTGAIELDNFAEDLDEAGVDSTTRDKATKALVGFTGGRGVMAVGDAPSDLAGTGPTPRI